MAAAIVGACGFATTTRAQVLIERVDVDNSGVAANSMALEVDMSSDGRVIAFSTRASNLSTVDTNDDYDVYVRDRSSGTTTLESIDSGGFIGFGSSRSPSLSADGSWLVFTSTASNLAPGAPVYWPGSVLLRDRVHGVNEWASVDAGGVLHSSSNGHVSGDGRFIAFISDDALLAGGNDGAPDLYVRDRVLGTLVRANVASDGTPADGDFYLSPRGHVLSADGRWIVFNSVATNLVPGDTNWHSDIFAHDCVTGQTRRVSVDALGAQVGLDSGWATISSNGRFVTFESVAKKLVPNDNNQAQDVFVADLVGGGIERVSVGSNGLELNGWSYGGMTTPDGRSTSFFTEATNLPGSANGYLRDRVGDHTFLLHRDAGGQPLPGGSTPDAISDDGLVLLLGSSHNLITGAPVPGLFVIDRRYETPLAYCTAGVTSHGCSASMSASGTPSASASSGFVIDVSGVEGQRPAMIFYGLGNDWDYVPLDWGPSSSFLCVKAPTQRTPAQFSGGTSNACDGAIALDWRAFMAQNPGALGNPLFAGRQVFAQAWLRDPGTLKTTALSNALAFTLQP